MNHFDRRVRPCLFCSKIKRIYFREGAYHFLEFFLIKGSLKYYFKFYINIVMEYGVRNAVELENTLQII